MSTTMPWASSQSATETFDLILLRGRRSLSAEEYRQITGKGVETVLQGNSKSFGDFMFEILRAFQVSDANALSPEAADYIILALQALVRMGKIQWGVVTGAVSERELVEATRDLYYDESLRFTEASWSC